MKNYFSLDLLRTSLLIRGDQKDYLDWKKENYHKSMSQQVRDLLDDEMKNDNVYQDFLKFSRD